MHVPISEDSREYNHLSRTGEGITNARDRFLRSGTTGLTEGSNFFDFFIIRRKWRCHGIKRFKEEN